MPSFTTCNKLALGGISSLLLGSDAVVGIFTHQCIGALELSCHNTTAVQDLCCFNAPGGQLLQTQFWDSSPPTGPSDSWTLHGLWPDLCDGTYEANCDPSREYTNISAIIGASENKDLLTFMKIYWKDYKGQDETFWEHEWAKHGTCVSSLIPGCYTDHKATEEVIDYLSKAVELFKTLPSYEWLKSAGIEPSSDNTYMTAQIQRALSAHRNGVQATIGCKNGVFNEIWYHYNVRGSFQTGEFAPAPPDGSKSTCPESGIKYLPKRSGGGSSPQATGKSEPTSDSEPTEGPQPTSLPTPGNGTTFSGKGFLNVIVGSAKQGCIIGKGAWYSAGTCASFTATSSGDGFTLSSSKGKCGVVAGAFACDETVVHATSFIHNERNLATAGSDSWSADASATDSTQQKVYAGSGHETTLTISWQGV